MPDETKKYPKVTTGVCVINTAGKVLLIRGERFDRKFHIPGGHVEWGETMADSAKREVKEETDLNVQKIEFVRPVEFIFDPSYDTSRHIIPLDFIAWTEDPETAVKLDEREASEFVWLTEAEIRQREDIEPTTKENILFYFDRQTKERQSEEYKAGWQRAMADYKNLQKETSERRQLLLEMSEQQILEEFIPVYGNMKQAVASITSLLQRLPADAMGLDNTNAVATNNTNTALRSVADGIGYIMKQFGDILKQHKVEEIKTVGEKFDPKFHEAAGEEGPSTTLGVSATLPEPGVILREVDGGYTMSGRVIKAAKVVIAK